MTFDIQKILERTFPYHLCEKSIIVSAKYKINKMTYKERIEIARNNVLLPPLVSLKESAKMIIGLARTLFGSRKALLPNKEKLQHYSMIIANRIIVYWLDVWYFSYRQNPNDKICLDQILFPKNIFPDEFYMYLTRCYPNTPLIRDSLYGTLEKILFTHYQLQSDKIKQISEEFTEQVKEVVESGRNGLEVLEGVSIYCEGDGYVLKRVSE
jgi:hypothetical protein